jgi:hypothetical protein
MGSAVNVPSVEVVVNADSEGPVAREGARIDRCRSGRAGNGSSPGRGSSQARRLRAVASYEAAASKTLWPLLTAAARTSSSTSTPSLPRIELRARAQFVSKQRPLGRATCLRPESAESASIHGLGVSWTRGGATGRSEWDSTVTSQSALEAAPSPVQTTKDGARLPPLATDCSSSGTVAARRRSRSTPSPRVMRSCRRAGIRAPGGGRA